MKKLQQSNSLSTPKKIIIICFLVVLGIFLLLKLKILSMSVHAPEQFSDLITQQPQRNNHDFSLWQPQLVENLPFTFFVPEGWSVLAKNPPGLFDLFNESTEPVAQLATYSFDKLAAQQGNLPETEYQKFGWTTAYGTSVFEHRDFRDSNTPKLTAFVVNTHTHDVVEITTQGVENVQVVQKMLKTMEQNRAEDDKSVKVYVDFDRDYLFKHVHTYVPVAPVKPEIPRHPLHNWQIRGPQEETLGVLSVLTLPKDEFVSDPVKLSALEALLQGKSEVPFQVIESRKLAGVNIVSFQAEDGEFWPNTEPNYPFGRGVLMMKDDEYVLIRFGWKEKKDLSAHAYEMSQVFHSVRFLTDQEKINQ